MWRMLRFQPHQGQKQILLSPARFRVVCCGRRWGKSLMAAVEATSVALAGGKVWVVAPDYDTAGIIFEECWRLSRLVERYVARRRVHTPLISYTSEGYIMPRSAENTNQLVGRGLDLIIIDECAKIRDRNVWWEYLRPCLSDRQGSALFISTPKGRNWFWDLWQMGNHPDYADYQSFQFPSGSNPYLDPRELETARATVPERVFRQEYLAEFLEDVGGVFSGVRSRLGAHRQTARIAGHTYAIGVDLAKYEDFTVIAVIDATTRELCHVERHQKEDWNLQIQRVVRASKFWNAPMCVDATGVGDPVCDALYQAGVSVVPFRFTTATKMGLIQELVLALEQGDLRLLDEEWLLQELENYQYERTEAGNLRMNAPEGKHDDGVIALALAWHLAAPYSVTAKPVIGGRRPVVTAAR